MNALRIREACVLLKETDMNVTEIARKSGFHSCSVFCQMFKRTVKLSPLQYRKNAKK
ncbi:MAG: helix-turn-helix domain-containing protein [Clostridia bacterium]|nr:helix-turn-helix domain-containing protein [Clostridia bacterium]